MTAARRTSWHSPEVIEDLINERKVRGTRSIYDKRRHRGSPSLRGGAKLDLKSRCLHELAMLNAKSIGYSTAEAASWWQKILQDLGSRR